MPLPELALALLALLLTPGPTNALLALAGAERGFARSLPLIPVEASAYLLTTIPLALAGAEVLATFPALRSAVTIAAAVWVAFLALRLWRIPATVGEASAPVTPVKIFVTTLLNPKALVIGLVLLPSTTPLAPRAALFALLIVTVAAGWAFLGSQLTRPSPHAASGNLPVLRRAGACWLAVLSVSLAASGIA